MRNKGQICPVGFHQISGDACIREDIAKRESKSKKEFSLTSLLGPFNSGLVGLVRAVGFINGGTRPCKNHGLTKEGSS